ncbi:MAG: DNA repair protein RecN [Bacteroidales bacterium]|nr:DNA repair protein RecN [Bacteroidales bacterium]
MLKQISIHNYALIESLEIDFEPSYSVITGETGAGKSILLGALSLILGNRADTGILKDKEKKCIVEAEFDIQRYSMKVFFDKNDIDYDEITHVRREISPTGRSRAFINDTPVTLNILKDLSVQLTDIHSQHQNLNLNDNSFQLNVLDAFAKLIPKVNFYKEHYLKYQKIKKEYQKLIERAQQEKSELDYLQFRFDELEEAKLTLGEQSEIESELKQLNHAEEITQNLATSFSELSDDDNGVLKNLSESISSLKQIQSFFNKAEGLIERLESTKIELDDISNELETLSGDIENNPERVEFLKERIDTIYALQNIHKVSSIEELISIKDDLQNKLDDITSFDAQISEKEKLLKEQEAKITRLADELSKGRREASGKLETHIINILQKLGMPSAKFKISQKTVPEFTETGRDYISFLFSANKHSEVQEIASIASGGEISRLMLSIKSVISDSMALPAIIFDEIDTGVSGDIAEKIGNIMKEMSENMQVISITHLPQVAARADYHYKVYKIEDEYDTRTDIKKLNQEERIKELATMLSGENVTDAALKNAEELLNS